MNEVVKYHNDLNTVIMRRWTKEEMNFFFAIIAKIREKGSSNIQFDLDELKTLSSFSNKHRNRWVETIERTATKLAQLTYTETNSDRIRVMTLFSLFNIDVTNKTIDVAISQNFEYVLNQLEAQFTVYELAEFTSIRSTYAKTMYRLLKQWRTIGDKQFTKKQLFELLDVPKSYQATHNFNKRVLNPIQTELAAYFNSLKITPIKDKKPGSPVIAYKFTWQAEKTGEWKDIKKLHNKKSSRTELVPENILVAEKEDVERKKKIQESFFQKAMKLRDKPFKEQSIFFSEARKVDTYRMTNASQFLDTLASLMDFDLEMYWSQVIKSSSFEGEPID
jgi:plasmid replication initiation protein